jgi:DNA sulfur modification protein DndB
MAKSLTMPALRGSFGDWIFYSCLMPVVELGARARYANEIHKNKALSELIQRSLEGARARHIAEYLSKTPERFFNSLVLATYGGNPEWFEVGGFQSTTKPELLDQISASALDSMGFLRLVGREKIFAIDGQHRLAGIKKAIEDGQGFEGENLPVILVGHKTSKSGLERTRRLFTTLNKTAVPVRKRDIIALDEDDAMAIVVRRLVEVHPWFRDPKIAVIASQNVPVGNRVCLTTISSLYDVLKIIFMHSIGMRSDRTLRFNRPPDERLQEFEELAVGYFAELGAIFPPVGELFASNTPAEVTERRRGPEGGHILFRPIGLEIVTRLAVEVASSGTSLLEAVRALSNIPVNLDVAPYRGVIWDPVRRTMIPAGKALARDVLKYMLGRDAGDRDELLNRYKRALGVPPDDTRVRLPAPV